MPALPGKILINRNRERGRLAGFLQRKSEVSPELGAGLSPASSQGRSGLKLDEDQLDVVQF